MKVFLIYPRSFLILNFLSEIAIKKPFGKPQLRFEELKVPQSVEVRLAAQLPKLQLTL